MRTPAMWSFGSCTPPFAQSLRLPAPSAEMNSRWPMIDGSACADMHSTPDATTGFTGLLTSHMVNPAKLPGYTKWVPKARSELMNVRPREESNGAGLCENDTRRRLLDASP